MDEPLFTECDQCKRIKSHIETAMSNADISQKGIADYKQHLMEYHHFSESMATGTSELSRKLGPRLDPLYIRNKPRKKKGKKLH